MRLGPQTCLAVLVVLLSLAIAEPTLPQTITRPGVTLAYDAGLDEVTMASIADVVSTANAAIRKLLPDLPEKAIQVQVKSKPTGWQNWITDREQTIYLHVGPVGFGEYYRADTGTAGMLCEAVAELYDPDRLAGFDRFIAHAYLVPAVVEALGPDPVPSNFATPLAPDGPEMLATLTEDTYALMHPDFAAVKALMAVRDRLQVEGLRALFAEIPAGTPDPFAALRQEAIAKQPELAQAFELYDEASRVEFGNDGSCLIASFEPDETVTVATSHPLAAIYDPLVICPCMSFEATPTDEWATDGTQSLRVHTNNPRPYLAIGITDPDWKLKDWTRFSRFAMDMKLEGPEPEGLSLRIEDDVAHGHGEVFLFNGILQPGEDRHIECHLEPLMLQGHKNPQSAYFSGMFRASEVGSLVLVVHQPTQPFTLYLDNLRVFGTNAPLPPRPPDLVSNFEASDIGSWRGLNPDYEHVTEGECAGRWERPDAVGVITFSQPMDWSPYQFLEFDCYSEVATNDHFIFYVVSQDRPRQDGKDEYWAHVFCVDWQGWKPFRIPFRRLEPIRNPIGWDRVTAIRMFARGWGMEADPNTTLVFDNMHLTEGEPRDAPPGTIEDFEEGPYAWWWMDEGSVPPREGKQCGRFPLHDGWRISSCTPLTTDWSPYRQLQLAVYTRKLAGEVLEVSAYGGDGRLEAKVPLDGEGWREVTVPLQSNPGTVSDFRLRIADLRGDDFGVPNRELDPEALLCLDGIRLTGREQALAAPPEAVSAAAATEAREHCEAAMAHKKAGRLPQAVDAFEAGIAADPECADAYWGLAWTYAEMKMTEKATEAFRTFIETEPHTDRARQARTALERLTQQ